MMKLPLRDADAVRALGYAIETEHRMSELYEGFAATFPIDARFWNRLVVEEARHASTLTMLKGSLERGVLLQGEAAEIFSPDPSAIIKSAAHIQDLIAQFNQYTPSRRQAFVRALNLEATGVELYFDLQTRHPRTPLQHLLAKMVAENDGGHRTLIFNYMADKGMFERRDVSSKPI